VQLVDPDQRLGDVLAVRVIAQVPLQRRGSVGGRGVSPVQAIDPVAGFDRKRAVRLLAQIVLKRFGGV
jgi:hypothetical protein